MTGINAGARLDRLPAARFHYRMLALIGGGMFLDAFEIYLQGGVLAALLATGWSTPAQNANFLSVTFTGMVIGAWLAGVAGDRYGRRFSYQLNLLVFGLASLAGALAPSMSWLIAARFVMGLGLGAEIVVGYVLITEMVPPHSRGRWAGTLAVITNSSLFVSALIGRAIIPTYGWRWMFVLVGVGALVVWRLRKNMPESPRWLEAQGRLAEAEAVLSAIEAEVAGAAGVPLRAPAPAPVSMAGATGAAARTPLRALFARDTIARTITGSVILIALNTALYGFLAFLPSFMVRQGMTITTSLNYTTIMSFGGPVGALIGMALADRLGRKPCIVLFSVAAIGFGLIYPHVAEAGLFTLVGFLLVTSLYVLVAIAWSMYVPELFATGIRMRGAGFCNMLGRLVTILSPQIGAVLYNAAGVTGVLLYVTALLALQAVVVGLVGIETRGAPLEALAVP